MRSTEYPVSRCRHGHALLWTIAALAIAGALVLPSAASAQVEGEGGDAVAVRPGSIAVAPFVNISGQAGDDWIGAGIAETVTADLERIDALSVVGREAFLEAARTQGTALSSASAPDAEAMVRQLGRELGVAWLVSGGYQRLGDRLRITARIVDVETGAVSTTVKVDGGVDEIFALQDRIVVELGQGFEPFRTPPAAPAERPLARRPGNSAGNGNGGGGRFVPPGGRFAPPAEPINSPETLTPENVTGGITLGSDEPQLGIAANAGVLTGRPAVRPPRARTGPDIDGRLDDAIWQSAARITEFVQRGPVEGAPATEDTDVYVAYDSQNIYIGVHAHYSDPSIMRANRSDRDQALRDDTVSVYFDTFLDQQRAYVFSVNGYGVQMDSIINSRGGGRFGGRGGGGRRGGGGGFSGLPRGDSSWDALFESGGQLIDDGFTAEMAIPFKSLRYPQRDSDTPHRWGFQVARRINGKDETVVWSSYSRAISGFLPQMGVLDGMSNLSTSRNIEIMPTFTAIQFGSLDTAGGFPSSTDPEGGVNFKYGITSNLTADVTFNPDFSQIESDRPQIEVNQRFALFFAELRPFFIEGAEIFRMSGPVTFVHTRTIVDPDYGGKITGKVGKMQLGLLVANDAAPGNLDDVSDPLYGQNANVFIGRARYDLYSESHIGAIFTNRDFLDSYSRLGGVDGNFRINRTQSVGFRAIQTEHQDLDRIQSSGQMFDVNYRMNGRHWSTFVAGYTLSPDFKTDIGFVRRTDQKRINGSVGYRFWPESWIINWGPRFNYGRNWNFDGIFEDADARIGIRASFAKNINLNVDVRRDMERFGGINFDKTGYSFGGGVNTSRKYSFGGFFRYGDEIRYTATPFLGRGGGGGIFITARPVARLQSEINLNTSRLIDPRNGDEPVFDVKIVRALTTYQFTDRLLLRNIAEYNTFQKTVGLSVLATYRVNAGTVFFIGYDDHYRQADLLFGDDVDGDGISDQMFPQDMTLRRTNRAFFTKLQYLFRY